MNYKISQVDAQRIMDYLAGRPYAEVVALIQILQTIQPIEESSPVMAPVENE